MGIDGKNPSLKHLEHNFFQILSYISVICDFPKSDYIKNVVILKNCMLFSRYGSSSSRLKTENHHPQL